MLHGYFDNNATAPVLPQVAEAMLEALTGGLGNPSSIHQRGQAAKAAMERARTEVASLIHAQPSEIVFTSGGTESNNLAIRGVLSAWREAHPTAPLPHLITSSIEHHSVLNVFEDLERGGYPVTYLRVNSGGRVDPASLAAALRPDTVLVSIMMANNETGVLQPIAELAPLTRAARVPFHVDAIQAAGKIPVDVRSLGCDLLSLSGHKLHASPGVGALYVRRRTHLRPILLGGHHERERRAGTENTAGIVGFGLAARLAAEELSGAESHLRGLRDRLESGILARIPGCGVVGGDSPRVPNTTNIYFDAVEGEALVISLDLHGFCASTGAACSSGALEPSHVLVAQGFSRQRARSCLRFSLGRQNTQAEVDALLEALPPLVERLRKLSPESERLVHSARASISRTRGEATLGPASTI